jgi:ribosomal protein L35
MWKQTGTQLKNGKANKNHRNNEKKKKPPKNESEGKQSIVLGNNPGTNVLELGDSKGWMKQLKN